MAGDPFKKFTQWMAQAKATEPNDPDAAALASVDGRGLPDVRMVLVRSWSDEGFVFFSHATSAKGKQLKGAGAGAALNFHWKTQRRQVRVRGKVSELPAALADDYFASRPRGHQLNAWASRQSQKLGSRAQLNALFAAAKKKFGTGDIPRPPYWVGFRLVPSEIEFWISRESRQHDRMLYKRSSQKGQWKQSKLFP